MDTSVNAANQVVSVGADIAFDADPKFFACLVRFESSSVPTTLPIAYDVYPLDGRHDVGYYIVKDCVTIDVLPRTPGNNVYVGFMVFFFFSGRRRHTICSRDWSSDVCSSDLSAGAPAEVARAHHGSVSRQERAEIEEALKAGRLPAVVATSSLELGIDMGAVDLVVQVEAPPSVASGLQRVGRAGHNVGDVSRGIIFPKYQGDLVQSAVVAERMRAGAIEELKIPHNPLDVLAQQIVAMKAVDDWLVDALEPTGRKAAPFRGLTRPI